MNIKEPLEKDIQNSICEYLELRKHFFWRQNTGGLYDVTKQIRRKPPKYAKNGVSDILLVKDGGLYCLEVKRASGRQSDDQRAFQKGIEDAGGKYFVVTSIEDVQKIGL